MLDDSITSSPELLKRAPSSIAQRKLKRRKLIEAAGVGGGHGEEHIGSTRPNTSLATTLAGPLTFSPSVSLQNQQRNKIDLDAFYAADELESSVLFDVPDFLVNEKRLVRADQEMVRNFKTSNRLSFVFDNDEAECFQTAAKLSQRCVNENINCDKKTIGPGAETQFGVSETELLLFCNNIEQVSTTNNILPTNNIHSNSAEINKGAGCSKTMPKTYKNPQKSRKKSQEMPGIVKFIFDDFTELEDKNFSSNIEEFATQNFKFAKQVVKTYSSTKKRKSGDNTLLIDLENSNTVDTNQCLNTLPYEEFVSPVDELIDLPVTQKVSENLLNLSSYFLTKDEPEDSSKNSDAHPTTENDKTIINSLEALINDDIFFGEIEMENDSRQSKNNDQVGEFTQVALNQSFSDANTEAAINALGTNRLDNESKNLVSKLPSKETLVDRKNNESSNNFAKKLNENVSNNLPRLSPSTIFSNEINKETLQNKQKDPPSDDLFESELWHDEELLQGIETQKIIKNSEIEKIALAKKLKPEELQKISSKSNINISEKHLDTAKALIKEKISFTQANETFKIPATVTFETASKKPIEISENALNHGKNLLSGIDFDDFNDENDFVTQFDMLKKGTKVSDPNLVHQVSLPKVISEQNKENIPKEDNASVLKRANQFLNGITVEFSSKGSTSSNNNEGLASTSEFKTASKSPIKISEEVLQIKSSDSISAVGISSPLKSTNNTSTNKKEISPEDPSKLKNNISSKSKTTFKMPYQSSKKPLNTAEQFLVSVKNAFLQRKLTEKTIPVPEKLSVSPKQIPSMPLQGIEKRPEIQKIQSNDAEENFEKMDDELFKNLPLTYFHTEQPDVISFKTASKKSIKISEEAIKKAKGLVKSVDDELSKEILSNSQKSTIDVTTENSTSKDQLKPHSEITGSNHQTVSEAILNRKEDLSGNSYFIKPKNNEIENLKNTEVAEKVDKSFSPISNKNTAVEISETTVNTNAKNIEFPNSFKTLETAVESFKKPNCIEFKTASQKNIKISEAALVRAHTLIQCVSDDFEKNLEHRNNLESDFENIEEVNNDENNFNDIEELMNTQDCFLLDAIAVHKSKINTTPNRPPKNISPNLSEERLAGFDDSNNLMIIQDKNGLKAVQAKFPSQKITDESLCTETSSKSPPKRRRKSKRISVCEESPTRRITRSNNIESPKNNISPKSNPKRKVTTPKIETPKSLPKNSPKTRTSCEKITTSKTVTPKRSPKIKTPKKSSKIDNSNNDSTIVTPKNVNLRLNSSENHANKSSNTPTMHIINTSASSINQKVSDSGQENTTPLNRTKSLSMSGNLLGTTPIRPRKSLLSFNRPFKSPALFSKDDISTPNKNESEKNANPKTRTETPNLKEFFDSVQQIETSTPRRKFKSKLSLSQGKVSKTAEKIEDEMNVIQWNDESTDISNLKINRSIKDLLDEPDSEVPKKNWKSGLLKMYPDPPPLTEIVLKDSAGPRRSLRKRKSRYNKNGLQDTSDESINKDRSLEL